MAKKYRLELSDRIYNNTSGNIANAESKNIDVLIPESGILIQNFDIKADFFKN